MSEHLLSSKVESACAKEFGDAMPPKPWLNTSPAKNFEPLINLIDQRNSSVLLRHEGEKYKDNLDFYDFARELEDNDKSSGTETFPNGVTASVEQVDGWPTRLVLEDKAADLKETSTFDETQHSITSDKVEFCGVTRSRQFSVQGVETYRAYIFPGGMIEKTGGAPVFKPEQTERQK